MKFFVLIFVSVFAISISTLAQGVIFDENDSIFFNSNISEIPVTRSIAPSKASLVNYLPHSWAFDQGSTGMCVAYSLAVARTILYAKNENLFSKDKITKESFSPLFIYFKSKNSRDSKCSNGLHTPHAVNFVLANGFAKLKDVENPNLYPYSGIRPNCDSYPPSIYKDLKTACLYKLDNVYKSANLIDIKTAISSGMPVVFSCLMPGGLMDAGGRKKEFWDSSKSYQCYGVTSNGKYCSEMVKNKEGYCDKHFSQYDNSTGHVMTIVGYDDIKYGGSFHIFNSWGQDWGKNGLIWMSYKDFFEKDFLRYAFALERKKEKSNSLFSSSYDEIKIDSLKYISSPRQYPFNRTK